LPEQYSWQWLEFQLHASRSTRVCITLVQPKPRNDPYLISCNNLSRKGSTQKLRVGTVAKQTSGGTTFDKSSNLTQCAARYIDWDSTPLHEKNCIYKYCKVVMLGHVALIYQRKLGNGESNIVSHSCSFSPWKSLLVQPQVSTWCLLDRMHSYIFHHNNLHHYDVGLSILYLLLRHSEAHLQERKTPCPKYFVW
jgi:hypothetical protein